MATKSVVFIDSRVSNYPSIIDRLNQPAEVFVIDGASDGLSQMASYLEGRTGIEAIHIISHGSVGALYLGSTLLDGGNLSNYQSQLASIGSSLTEIGDILLYGCDVAQGNIGMQFIGNLAQATGADVAASSNATGAQSLGGDWVLEEVSGSVEVVGLQINEMSNLLADTTAPTVTITDNVPGIANRITTSVTYILTFSEAVTGLDFGDFTVTNGTVSGGSGSGATWIINVTPRIGVSNENISFSLKAGAVVDLAGNPNTLATNTAQALDTGAPIAPKLVTNTAFNYLVDPQVTLQTTMGAVVLELNPEAAPITVANMLAYVNSGFCDGTLFHRVIPNFMAQGGGFNTGLATKTPTYSAIPLESNNGLSNLRGTIAMARTNVADSATSQFFINQVDNTFLNYASASSLGYTVFGKVLSGMTVIDSMVKVTTATVGQNGNVPITDITITSAQQTLAGSSITNAATLAISGLESGATWSYTLNAGATWTAGTGTSLTVPVGDYAASAIQVRQTDAVGVTSLTTGALTSALVVETTAPTVTQFSPTIGSTDSALTANILLTFSEAIQRGSGTILLKTAGGTTVESYDAAKSTNISVSGSTLTINPSADLTDGTAYTVEFAAGTVKDLAGNSYAGTSSYSFTTFDNPLILNSTPANDAWTSSSGNDTVDGGSGVDTLVLNGNLSGYTLTKTGRSYTVRDNTGFDGIDTATNVEALRFTDKTVNLTIQAKAAAAPQADVQNLAELYVAFFNRVPDADGLSYWIDQKAGGLSLNQIADSFYAAGIVYSEQTGFTTDMTDADFVRLVYKNVLGRSGATAPPDGDVNYWAGDIHSGNATRGSLISTMLYSAHTFKGDGEWGWVADLLDNKIAVSKTFAIEWGLNFNTPQDSITQGMAIAAAITPTGTQEAIALIGVSGADMHLV
jgi:cyclophilin family peptidyl-prolyl cis-trans isomerase/methionine-rich copper-binding protein CopC